MRLTFLDGVATAPCVFTKAAMNEAIHEAGYFPDGNIHEEFGWRQEPPRLWCRVKRIVLFDDPESVSLIDTQAWRNNVDGATHKRCNDCSALYPKRSYCKSCSETNREDEFLRLKPVEYKGQACVIGDSWFFEEYELKDHLLEFDIMPQDARVEEASAEDLPEIELEHWHDHLPEDYDEHTLHPAITSALNALNLKIRAHGKGVTYYRNGNRIVLPEDFLVND